MEDTALPNTGMSGMVLPGGLGLSHPCKGDDRELRAYCKESKDFFFPLILREHLEGYLMSQRCASLSEQCDIGTSLHNSSTEIINQEFLS